MGEFGWQAAYPWSLVEREVSIPFGGCAFGGGLVSGRAESLFALGGIWGISTRRARDCVYGGQKWKQWRICPAGSLPGLVSGCLISGRVGSLPLLLAEAQQAEKQGPDDRVQEMGDGTEIVRKCESIVGGQSP